MILYLLIDEKAIGKGRPRFFRGHAVTPKTTRDYENMIKEEFEKQHKDFKPIETPIKVTIECYYSPPKSLSNKKRAELISTPYIKKPDCDNIAKAILDALNGVAYVDDSQIYLLTIVKNYNEKDFIKIKIETD